MSTSDYHRDLIETVVAPATIMFILAMPAVLSGTGLALVLSGQWRGLAALLLPALLAKFAWDSRFDWSWPDPFVQYASVSWLAGLPIGLLAWAVVRLFS